MNSVCCSHAVVIGPTSKRLASDDGICSGKLLMIQHVLTQPTAYMAADKKAVGLSRIHMHESKCILPLGDNYLFSS